MSKAIPAVLALALGLAGCAATRPAERPATLRASPVFAPAAAPGPQKSMSLAPVIARGAAADLRYTYVDRDAPREVRQAKTLFWEEAPPRILERALADGIAARVGPISAPDTPAVADRRLVVRLRRFEEITGGGRPAEAAVSFDANVLGPNRTLILSGAYCATAPISGAAASDRALGFEAALKAAVSNLADDIARGTPGPRRC